MPPFLAGLIVFCASAAVLVLEILAARLLAPYVGVTLETYTGIIGTVLAGIAVGAWYGGRLADRIAPRRLLGPMLLLGGVLALVTVPVITLLGTALTAGGAAGGPPVIILLTLGGFFFPAAVLSAVSPTVVKVQLRDLAVTGHVVGKLSAIGTTGAIFGTFVTGFVLVAAWPTRPIIIALGVALIAGGVALWWWLAPGAHGSPATYGIAAVLLGALTLGVGNPCDYESAYYCARVEVDPDNPSGRVLVLDRLRHSYIDLDNPANVGFSYMEVFADVLAATAPGGEAVDALHIGGGGMTMPRYLEAVHPGSHSVVLEIDPLLVEIAEREFGVEPGPDLEVVVGDARLSVRRMPEGAFDVVIGDAFGGLAVPWHLTTREFIEQVHAAMRPDGVYMINLIDHPPLGFAHAKTATLAAAFEHVAVIAPPARLAGHEGGNFVLVGSDAPLDADAIAANIDARGGDQHVAAGDSAERFAGDASVLSDDYAPVDQLLTPRG
jgi:spermidine synthase